MLRRISAIGLALLGAVRASLPVVYHVLVVVLSAGIALSLPSLINWIARTFLRYWAFIENEKLFLVSIEVILAIVLIVFFHYLVRSWRYRKIARIANGAGIIDIIPAKGRLARGRVRRLKEKQGYGRDVLIISSTGFRTFAHSSGELHNVLRHCRGAKIMLLNPFAKGAEIRAKSLMIPGLTVESFKEQLKESIKFLKGLRAAQRPIRLKLYSDAPFIKLAVLGDYVWAQYYHGGLDVRLMPEYLFRHDQKPGSLYAVFYQFFLLSWEDPLMPEFDFDSDELLYRDKDGNLVRREPLEACESRNSPLEPEGPVSCPMP